MSDAAKNVEIEDVLASIRRLVSDEVTRELDAETFADPAPEPPAYPRPSALILTPSLRVHETPEDEGTDVAHDAAGEQDMLEDPGAESDEEVLQPSLEEPEAQEEVDPTDDAQSALALSQTAMLQAVADQVASVAKRAEDATSAQPEDAQEDDEIEEADTGVLTLPFLAPSEPQSGSPDAKSKPIAEPQADEHGAMLGHDGEPAQIAGAETETVAETLPEMSDVLHLMSPEAPTPQDDRAALEAKIAQLETMIDGQDENWEVESEPIALATDWQDAAEEEAPEQRVADWEDALAREMTHGELDEAPSEVTAVLEGEMLHDADQPHHASSEDAELVDPNDLLVDEDMLRGIVTSIVREELRGVLGERITRNVRKLVRREIQRALASHELD
ncbi:hypothetical protein [Primorskyibacter sp. S187A]|uniref:hypothetical protein n=1 Tax=Primorskyibacter sp. S187A TaxID=3415130 RepID=UPI003C7C7647